MNVITSEHLPYDITSLKRVREYELTPEAGSRHVVVFRRRFSNSLQKKIDIIVAIVATIFTIGLVHIFQKGQELVIRAFYGRKRDYHVYKDTIDIHPFFGNFGRVPTELINKIFNYFTNGNEPLSNYKTLCSLEQTSTLFKDPALCKMAELINKNRLPLPPVLGTFQDSDLKRIKGLQIVKKLGDKLKHIELPFLSDKDVQQIIKVCTNLTSFNTEYAYCYITDNTFEKIRSISTLTCLKIKICAKNYSLNRISRLTQLKELSVRATNKDASFLKSLTNLEKLELYPVDNQTLMQLQPLTNLKNLLIESDLQNPPFISKDGLEYLSNMSKLEIFKLKNAPVLSNDDLSPLEKLNNLKSISLTSFKTTISSAGLAHFKNMPKLERLAFKTGEIIDQSIFSTISNMRQLKHLSIKSPNSWKLLQSDFKFLAQHIQLEKIDFGYRFDPAGLENFSELKEVKIWGQFPPKSLENLRQLHKLKKLSLSFCDLTNNHLAQVKEISSIENLDLKGNAKLSLQGLRLLSEMPNLKVLNLKHCKLNYPDLKGLLNSKKIKKIILGRQHFISNPDLRLFKRFVEDKES